MSGSPNVERDAKIRARREQGLGYREIALEFGISRERVRQIVWKPRWRAEQLARREAREAAAAKRNSSMMMERDEAMADADRRAMEATKANYRQKRYKLVMVLGEMALADELTRQMERPEPGMMIFIDDVNVEEVEAKFAELRRRCEGWLRAVHE